MQWTGNQSSIRDDEGRQVEVQVPKASRTYENVGPLKKARVSKQDPGFRKNTGFPNSGKS